MSKPQSSHIEQLLNATEEEHKKQYSFYLDEKVYKAFMQLCKKHNLSGSKVINAAMKDFLLKYGDR